MELEIYRKLPDAEFDVMCAIWSVPAPATTPVLMRVIGNEKGWRAPTLISFLVRLEDRGFIRSEKNGKERQYYPMIEKKTYMTEFTKRFLNQYYGGSLKLFLDTLAGDGNLDSSQFDELLGWLQSRA